MNDKESVVNYLHQAQAQFASQVITAMSATMHELEPIINALGEVTRDEAVEALKKVFAEKMDALK